MMHSLFSSSVETLRLLVSASVRGGLLLLLVTLVAACVPERRASVRHFLWALGLAQLALLTVLVPFVPAWHTKALPASPLAGLSFAAEALPSAGIAPTLLPTPHAAVSAASSGGVSPTVVVLILWAAGTLLLLARRLGSWRAARALVRSAHDVTDERLLSCLAEQARGLGLARLPVLRLSSRIAVPLATGIRRPVLLLPTDALGWTDDLQRTVLAHELAHVRRRDLAIQLGGDLVRALHWPNPMVWLATARLLVERERSADDCVVATGARCSDYAGHLLQLAQAGAGDRFVAAGASMVGRSQLRQRLERLLKPSTTSRGNVAGLLRRRTAIVLALVAGASALPMACLEGASAPSGPATRLVYKVDQRRVDETTAVLTRRLEVLGLEGARVIRGPAAVTVDIPSLPAARRNEVKRALAASGRLRFILVENDSDYSHRLADYARQNASVTAAGISVQETQWRPDDSGAVFHDVFLQGPLAPLTQLIAHLPANLQPPPGHQLLIDGTGKGEQYRTIELDHGRGMEIANAVDATVYLPTEPGDMYRVSVGLSPADGARLEALTRPNIGRHMAILFDESDLWGAPMIRSAMSTRVSVTSRGSLAEAEQLAGGIRGGGLPAPLELIQEDVSRRLR